MGFWKMWLTKYFLVRSLQKNIWKFDWKWKKKNRTKVVGLNIEDRVNFDYHTKNLLQKAKSYRHYQGYLNTWHYVKSVQIRSFFWSVFSRIRTEYGPEKTPYLNIFRTMWTYIKEEYTQKITHHISVFLLPNDMNIS